MTTRGDWAARLVRLQPAPGSAAVAVRAGVSLGVPLVVLVATGRTSFALYATFGAFAAVYGRTADRRARWRMQAGAGSWLTACVGIGAAVGVAPGRAWLVVPVAAAVAGSAAMLGVRAGWRPPGPLFAVFAVAACASVPTTAARLGEAVAIAASVALFSVLVGLVDPHRRAGSAAAAPAAPADGPAFDLDAATTSAVRHGVAALVAGVLPTALGLGHPYWAVVAAVAATSGTDRTDRVLRGVQRIVGTLVGIGLTAAVLAPDPSPAVVVAVAVVAQMATELLVGRNYALALVFVTPLAILMVELGRPEDPAALLRDRTLETVIGGALGIAASLVRRPSAVRSGARPA